MISNTMKSETNVKLPLAFILYGLIALIIAQIILFINSDLLTNSSFRLPDIWMGAHFLLLGYAVMIAMGAMYQLVPVAFLTPIWSHKLGYIQFVITALGFSIFSVLLGLKPEKAIFGGILAIVGVLLFLIQMARTILSQKEKNKMTYFVLGALSSFFLTISAGFLLAWNLSYGEVISHQTILGSHIVLGVGGWFSLLIFGFSYKLVPMFSLSHGYSMKWAKSSFVVYITGLLLLILSFWTNFIYFETLGWILLFLGFLFFTLDIKEILAKRMKKKLDKPFIFSLVAIGNGLVIHFIALLFHMAGYQNPISWSWIIFLYIMCWIVFSILGYLYKIVPFLWWTYKYSNKIGKEKVPTLKDMIHESWSVVLFICFITSVLGLTVGGLGQWSHLVITFQGLLTLTSILYTCSIFRVLLK
ncbi:hypothetical protein [Virgibacillus halodenitrificans]|uniref:hypothetical protein n=2 Tax=Virgibacillus halodenitrificans TaxID=1482 RepID=UPI001F36DED9|nr:hypothetical protein [Virgibacillus halodenitrificans]MCJ0932316.1 hypothetical protein [Virgibacillus halodenitrificans]